MNNKNENKLAAYAILLNFVLAIVLVFVFNALWSLERRVNLPAAPIAENKAVVLDQAGSGQPRVDTQDQKKTKNINITVNDKGFLPSGFQLGKNEIANISVTNEGQLPHSLVIDDLDIDTGDIEPGQSKMITIDKRFDGAAAMEYHSNSADDPKIFKGTIMVF